MNNEKRILELKQKIEKAELGGGQEAIEKQHKRGKLTARERIDLLMDPHSFQEIDKLRTHTCTDFGMEKKKFYGDGIVTGYGSVKGRLVFVYSFDFTVIGGTLSKTVGEKVSKIMETAAKVGAPVVGINDSGGARIQEGVDALAGYTSIFIKNILYSGVIPQISAIVGPCAGGAVYSPALTDFIFMVRKTANMFLTGPKVVEEVTREKVTSDELGGADVHGKKSGVTHFTCDTEQELFEGIRDLIEFLPQNNTEESPVAQTGDDPHRMCVELNSIVPENPNKPYDMKQVIQSVVDNGNFLEVHKDWAQNIIVGFARLNGKSVGIVANQPRIMAGVLDSNASVKGARFVRFCDCFNIPVITFEDVPGFLPGTAQEYAGIISHGAKLMYAYGEATVPKLTVITRKAYGGAYCVMNSKQLRGDMIFAWPTGEIAVMGAEGASKIVFAKEIKQSENPDETLKAKIQEYRERFANPYVALEKGFIDDIIVPENTRFRLIKAHEMLKNKRDENPPKKHGNIPL